MSKNTFQGLLGILAIIALILGLRVLFDRCSFGFFAANAWPQIEESLGNIEGYIDNAIELLDDGKISEARKELNYAKRESDSVYRRYFSDSGE